MEVKEKMIYKQDASFLRYDAIPFSSYIYNYSPFHKTQPLELKRNGIFQWCILHNHIAIEILRVTHGQVIVSVNGTRYELYEGDIVFMNPFDVHTVSVIKADTINEYQVINFDISILHNNTLPDFNEYIADIEQSNLKYQTLIPHTLPFSFTLNETMKELHANYNKRNLRYGFMLIVSGLLRLLSILEENGFSYPSTANKVSKQTIFSQKTVQYVCQNYALPLTTEKIAEDLHFNKSYFCRNFKATFEQTFVEYLNRYRISVAKSLSIEDHHTLEDIAQAVGYSNYNIFSTYFKRYTGYSPKTYFKKS